MDVGLRSRERERHRVSNRRFSHDPRSVCADGGRSGCLGPRPVRRRSASGSSFTKRLVQVATAVSAAPQHSLPKACGDWADTKGAYRFLNNRRVTPDAVQTPHRDRTRTQCAHYPIVLNIQDLTDLDYSHLHKTQGLGPIGNGQGRGLLQHTVLAVTPQREVLGLLHQTWTICPTVPEGETRDQRRDRATKTDL